jgi:hypothetical protein
LAEAALQAEQRLTNGRQLGHLGGQPAAFLVTNSGGYILSGEPHLLLSALIQAESDLEGCRYLRQAILRVVASAAARGRQGRQAV